MRIICIIPARAGSKRLHNKNLLPFKGKPLITNVIEMAIRSNLFAEVIVSSEDATILNTANNSGATCHKRPAELATDNATVAETCNDVLLTKKCESFCCIYATAVLLKEKTLCHSSEIFESFELGDVDVLMGVSAYNFHPFQALTEDENGNWKSVFEKFNMTQSQLYPKTFVSNGTFYWAKSEYFKNNPSFYAPKLRVFEVNPKEVLDINTPIDYQNLISNYGE